MYLESSSRSGEARSWGLAGLVLALLLTLVGSARAQNLYFFGTDEGFDPSIPTPAEFLGYEIGSHLTRYDQIVAYLAELARLSDRASFQVIGRTWEHRDLVVLTVTAPENHDRLEEIRVRHLEGLDPRAPRGASGLVAASGDGVDEVVDPVLVHLGYGVHGNETSSSEAALLTAYWLVARLGVEHDSILRAGVFHIEPTLNPDGRDRHAQWVNSNKAIPPVGDPLDREHNEIWPGGRGNHYWFDLNRDWLPLVHPESRARVEFHQRWYPHVVTDYHEMGAGSTYYFEPSEPRSTWNPLIPERMYTEITEDFASYYATALDEIGSLYFTKEQFDNFYPGYGSTYPKFLGGYAITFEQASARGHLQENPRHGTLTFPFAIRNHLRTSLATIRAAVDQKTTLQEYQREFFESAITEAERFPVRGYVFGDRYDQGRNRAFLDLLLRHRIEVFELADEITTEGETFSPGSAWVVPTAQPHYRLVRSIFERTSEYVDSVFYDASTWTTSLAYGIPDAELRGRLPLGERISSVPQLEGLGEVPVSRYAYLLDWSDHGAVRALYHLLARGVYAEGAYQPFTAVTSAGKRSYPRGTVSVPVQRQGVSPEELHSLILEAERVGGVTFQSVSTGYSVEGIDLGSGNFRTLSLPRAAIIVGDGVSAYEAGQIWHLLDHQVGLPVTKLDQREYRRADLNGYDVLILPSGDYPFISGGALEELKGWVRGGGTLITIRTAAAWAARNGLTPNVDPPATPSPLEIKAATGEIGRRDYADARALLGAQRIGGSIWEGDLDPTHPLGFGYHRRRLPVWRDHSLFFEPSKSPFNTVVQLTDDPFLSGYISTENRERLRNSPSAVAEEFGRGKVILLIDNPNFRGYWLGTQRLLFNALTFR